MNIGNSFEEFCYEEEQRNGIVTSGESEVEKVPFQRWESKTMLVY